jgi:hypothetical protein
MKVCNCCNKEKNLKDFYKRYAKCKSCCSEVKKKYRASEKGKELRKREAINARITGKQQARQKRYEQTEKGKLQQKKYDAKRYEGVEGKAKLAAKNAVKYALKVGKLVKQPCWICGESMSEAHHSSYAKDMRLAVTWLCSAHHNEIHNPRGV